MNAQTKTLEKMAAYQTAVQYSNNIWETIRAWDFFERKTVGEQWLRASDAISTQLSEGRGRGMQNDSLRYYRYAMGSLFACFDWTNKAHHRGLVDPEQFRAMLKEIKSIRSAIEEEIQDLQKHEEYYR